MFSANETPAEEFETAARLGATINLDDLTHVDFLHETIGYIPKKISCRFNPGGIFTLGESKEGFQVMDNPGDAKYGLTRPQMTEAFRKLKALGAEAAASPADAAATEMIFDTLLGDNLPARKKFITENGDRYMKDIDV